MVLAVLGLGTARAQELLPPPVPYESARGPAATPADTVPPPTIPAPAGLSSWMMYSRHDCCGPIGGNGPIREELFLRAGPSLPAEGAIFGHVLETGWVIEGGGRSLFFNPEMDRAWAVTLSLSNINNHGQRSDIKIPYNVNLPSGTNPINGQPTGVSTVPITVTVRELNRTFANISLGQEWYLWGSPDCCTDPRCRVGIDAGGRLGSAKIRFNELRHHSDVVSAVFIALHGDLEIPRGCCTFMLGFRVEWDYTWMDILQIQNNSDLEDVNFLVTAGVRF